MVVEGVCLLVVLIGRLGRRGTGLVGMPNEVPVAVEHEFGPPAVQCESRASLNLLEDRLSFFTWGRVEILAFGFLFTARTSRLVVAGYSLEPLDKQTKKDR